MNVISTPRLVGGLIASALLTAMAGCGSQDPPGPLPGYGGRGPAKRSATHPHDLAGPRVRKSAHWSRLTEQIGTASPLVITPARTAPAGTPRSKSHSVKTAVTTTAKATVSSKSSADTPDIQAVSSAPSTLAAVVARPHGISRHVQWTLVVRTQVHEITLPVPYWLMSLTWTERGDLARE